MENDLEKNETPDEAVNRLIEKRENEEVDEEEAATVEIYNREYALEEVETLKIENAQLKQEHYAQKIRMLEYEMTGIVGAIKDRLNLPEDDCLLQISPDRTKVVAIKKGDGG